MKRSLFALLLCLLSAFAAAAQQPVSDQPASKQDIERYLDAMHSREMIANMLKAMSKPMHQMIHEQYLKDKDKLPADFEERMNKRTDEMMNSFPWDEMMDAMVPVYQKHFTKGDVDSLVAFYTSPTGQKVLREMPSIMAESMQTVMPLVQKQMASITDKMQQEVAQMVKDSGGKTGSKSASTPN